MLSIEAMVSLQYLQVFIFFWFNADKKQITCYISLWRDGWRQGCLHFTLCMPSILIPSSVQAVWRIMIEWYLSLVKIRKSVCTCTRNFYPKNNVDRASFRIFSLSLLSQVCLLQYIWLYKLCRNLVLIFAFTWWTTN